MSDITLLFGAILLSAVLILFSTLAFRWLCLQVGLVDNPGSASHKLHTAPKPIAGGIALLFVLVLSAAAYGTSNNPQILAAFAAGGLVFAFGLWDDFRNLPFSVKLAGQVLGAIVLIRLGVYIRIFESPEFFFSLGDGLDRNLDFLLTIFWVVGVTNAFNFVDSMDGLAVGLGAIASFFFMLMTLDAGQLQLSIQCALLLGICVGLYFFNSPPAFVFLGDSGAQTLGFILAVIAIVYRPQGAYQTSSWLVPILVLGLPIFDTCLVVVSRLRRNRPIYRAGRDHTYHRLVAFGLDSNHAVLTMHFSGLILGCLAFVALFLSPLYANLILAVSIVLGAVCIILMDRRCRWP